MSINIFRLHIHFVILVIEPRYTYGHMICSHVFLSPSYLNFANVVVLSTGLKLKRVDYM